MRRPTGGGDNGTAGVGHQSGRLCTVDGMQLQKRISSPPCCRDSVKVTYLRVSEPLVCISHAGVLGGDGDVTAGECYSQLQSSHPCSDTARREYPT